MFFRIRWKYSFRLQIIMKITSVYHYMQKTCHRDVTQHFPSLASKHVHLTEEINSNVKQWWLGDCIQPPTSWAQHLCSSISKHSSGGLTACPSVLLGLRKPPAHRELLSLLFRKGEQKQSPLIQREDPWRCVVWVLTAHLLCHETVP